MKRPLLIGAVTVAAFAALANAGLKLIGARQQIAALASASRAHASSLSGPEVPERGTSATRGAVQTESAHVVKEPAPMNTEPAAEPAVLPGSGFDPEAAIHAAAEQDPGVAELLNDPDPAVGAAIRDFVTSVEPPDAH